MLADRADRQETGANRLAVDLHRASAALRDAAAELRSGSPITSLSAHRSGVSGATSIVCRSPLTSIVIAMLGLPFNGRAKDRLLGSFGRFEASTRQIQTPAEPPVPQVSPTSPRKTIMAGPVEMLHFGVSRISERMTAASYRRASIVCWIAPEGNIEQSRPMRRQSGQSSADLPRDRPPVDARQEEGCCLWRCVIRWMRCTRNSKAPIIFVAASWNMLLAT